MLLPIQSVKLLHLLNKFLNAFNHSTEKYWVLYICYLWQGSSRQGHRSQATHEKAQPEHQVCRINLGTSSCFFMWQRYLGLYSLTCLLRSTNISRKNSMPSSMLWVHTLLKSNLENFWHSLSQTVYSSSFLLLTSSNEPLTTKCPNDYQFRTDYGS